MKKINSQYISVLFLKDSELSNNKCELDNESLFIQAEILSNIYFKIIRLSHVFFLY